MAKKQYLPNFFLRRDVIKKANLFGLTSIENFDLTLKGLIAKMKEWQKEHNGVEAYVYDLTEKELKRRGSKMPKHIKRVK
ncbi:MAG: hypothetical protein Q7T18_03390 [Sedimentisphaerales bacterium]|nr:hypothetical protein [Sedimentisphaerales bacterium]